MRTSPSRRTTTGRERGLPIHPARFPRELARFCIGLATDPGDVVFEPCAGSLTTLATALEMDRYAIAGELHREYVLGGRGRLLASPAQPA